MSKVAGVELGPPALGRTQAERQAEANQRVADAARARRVGATVSVAPGGDDATNPINGPGTLKPIHGDNVGLRLNVELLAKLDRARAAEPDVPTRQELIRRILEEKLK